MKAYSKTELKNLLAQAELSEVLVLLSRDPHIQQTDVLHQKLGNLQKNHKDLTRRDQMGMIGFQAMSESRNQLVMEVLQLIEEM